MRIKFVVLLGLALFVAGCAPVDSLNPLYTDKDVIFDSSLLGDWVSPDPDNKSVTRITEFTEIGAKLRGYDIAIIDEDGGADFHAHLVNLDGQHLLDAVTQNWDSSSDSYVLHLNQSKGESRLEPHLLRLGMAAYMEFSDPKEGKIQARLRPAHWFFKLTTDGKKLRLDYIDDEKLAQAVAQGGVHISHSLLGEGKSKDIVVTASTRELQQFILEHINDDKVFTEHSDLVRKP